MSSALGIAAVTAVLKNLLDNQLIEQGVAAGLGDVSVTALPPDHIATRAGEKSRLNPFLYRLTPNSAWRRAAQHDDGGHSSHRRRALALDLHHELTAYSEQDLQAKILRGSGIQVLHEAGSLDRQATRSSLAVLAPTGSAGVIAPAARAALSDARLADAVERLEVTLEFPSTEGNIRNTTLHAAFLAAEAGTPVRMSHLRHAAQGEYAKLEESLTEAETAGWGA